MNTKKLISALVLMTGIASGQVYAGVSEQLRNICNQTTANIVAGVQLKKYISDINTNTEGVYVVADVERVWFIPSAKNYPDSVLTAELRKTAMAAILSDTKVNLCTKYSSGPHHIWAMELDRES
ncbi:MULTISPECIES: Heat-labile enterotoxin IIA, B chain [Enterobacteriaceae]|uniref:Heat-labile enterotoxin IIA, B chain n=1 Tax=Enterobacteriaceae TaxID=543 RepID=UPI000B7D4F5C|nr:MULTISPECIES: Heat-labile enterotoxin IIA, B chain [Enterobacteriaceae]EFB2807869.1 Heat-labile enterotoxin IIA, B chain [Escherichia coli]EFN9439464.1 Heat-labile enterotoxin IIA, B chain [Escherichia coli]EFO0989580.1 Heat-labile enterotoxin IIA, B chain [Escherichia coli]EFO3745567.1 Heat-labile enterotoxin IIA, B chain [Escherichia coli]EHN4671335.1 Heat-labile enterotoxin IIA, B chain [Escherichia coli]